MPRSAYYDTDLLGGSLMVRESRKVATLLLEGVDEDAWKDAILNKNILQKNTLASAKRNAKTIRARLELMEPEFLIAIRDGDDELATQAAFCAALERNLLLIEFLERVLKDSYATHQEKLQAYQWIDFVEESGQRDPNIYDWKESSIKKMGQVVFRILAEVGYFISTRTLKLQNMLIRPEIRTMLENTSRQRMLNCMDMSI